MACCNRKSIVAESTATSVDWIWNGTFASERASFAAGLMRFWCQVLVGTLAAWALKSISYFVRDKRQSKPASAQKKKKSSQESAMASRQIPLAQHRCLTPTWWWQHCEKMKGKWEKRQLYLPIFRQIMPRCSSNKSWQSYEMHDLLVKTKFIQPLVSL